MKQCPRCGKYSKDNMAFCTECGARFNAVPGMHDQYMQKQRKKARNRVIAVVIGLCLLAVVIGVLGMMILGVGPFHEDPPETQTEWRDDPIQASGEQQETESLREPDTELSAGSGAEREPESVQEAEPGGNAVMPSETVSGERLLDADTAETAAAAEIESAEMMVEVSVPPTEAPTVPPTEAPTAPPTQAAAASGEYIFEDSDTRYLTEAELEPYNFWMLQLAINEIYARRHYKFGGTKHPEVKAYFENRSWYKGTNDDQGSVKKTFNDIELANEKLIRDYQLKYYPDDFNEYFYGD